MTITREGFSEVVANSFVGLELPPEAAQVTYPVRMFEPGSDLTPIADKIDDLIAGLTKWKPATKGTKTAKPAKIKVQGKDYEEAIENVNRLFLKNMWSDGLPILPPTEERVNWIMTGTDLSPDKQIARILPRGGIVTVEIIAINLAMAGGRPEYLPVLIAAIEAITAPEAQHQRMNSTTCSAYPAVIVNGQIRKQIRLASGYGCLGPDPLHPAGASIGRTIRLLLQGAGGAVPGIGTMATFGGPARYTNIVFAEDEEGLPSNWEPLNAEQGFRQGSNTVTTYAVASTTNITCVEAGDEKSALLVLNQAAQFMSAPNGNYWMNCYNPEGAAGILLISSGNVQGLSRLGWSKERIKTYLWENSKLPASRNPWQTQHEDVQDPAPISVSPQGIKIVVAGGLPLHMMWLQVACCPERPTSAEINLPANWDELLKNAEKDLGPLPAR